MSFEEIGRALDIPLCDVMKIYNDAILKLRDSDLQHHVRKADVAIAPGVHCAAYGCLRAIRAHGFCDTHYRQIRRIGEVRPIGRYGLGRKPIQSERGTTENQKRPRQLIASVSFPK